MEEGGRGTGFRVGCGGGGGVVQVGGAEGGGGGEGLHWHRGGSDYSPSTFSWDVGDGGEVVVDRMRGEGASVVNTEDARRGDCPSYAF